jgi:tetratricopeptide (TPR) repeat protein
MKPSQALLVVVDQVPGAVKRWLYIVAAVLAIVPAAFSQTSSKSAIEYYNRGSNSFRKHDYDRAIDDFTTAIAFDPGFAWAYDNRGIARFEKGDVAGAIDDFSRALELDPHLAGADVNRGRARDAKGDRAGGLKITIRPRCLIHETRSSSLIGPIC